MRARLKMNEGERRCGTGGKGKAGKGKGTIECQEAASAEGDADRTSHSTCTGPNNASEQKKYHS